MVAMIDIQDFFPFHMQWFLNTIKISEFMNDHTVNSRVIALDMYIMYDVARQQYSLRAFNVSFPYFLHGWHLISKCISYIMRRITG